jgi:hypothetical protein
MKIRNAFLDTLRLVVIFALCYLILCIFASPAGLML